MEIGIQEISENHIKVFCGECNNTTTIKIKDHFESKEEMINEQKRNSEIRLNFNCSYCDVEAMFTESILSFIGDWKLSSANKAITFRNGEEPEVLHIIKTGYVNDTENSDNDEYIVIYEDPWDVTHEVLTVKQIKDKYNIKI